MPSNGKYKIFVTVGRQGSNLTKPLNSKQYENASFRATRYFLFYP